ncbi:MAG: hypothetical protein ACJAQT_005211 [Akkermansiaceae bacterium]|jgi:hypothetical protein
MSHLQRFENLEVTPPNDRLYRGTGAQIRSLIAYNLPEEKWDFPAKQPFVLDKAKRAGILSHPSWLMAHSLNATTDPIRRGKWIRERLLAGTIPEIPLTVDASIPEDPHKSLRERYAVTEAEYCWKCHVKMNPLGYPFEIVDDFGRLRELEVLEGLPTKDKKPQSKPINSHGFLKGSGNSRLDGEVEDAYALITRLGKSRRTQQSFMRYAFHYWMGRNELLPDSKTLIRAEKDYMHNEGSFNALIVSLLTSDSFLYRKR